MKRLPLASLLLVDFIAYIPNFPEMHLETRPAAMVPPPLMAMYFVAIFLPLVALGLLWKWPRLAGWLAMVCGVLNIIPSLLDLTHVLFPIPPPRAIAIDEAFLILLGAALIALGRKMAKGFQEKLSKDGK